VVRHGFGSTFWRKKVERKLIKIEVRNRNRNGEWVRLR